MNRTISIKDRKSDKFNLPVKQGGAAKFSLGQNVPNPFEEETAFRFSTAVYGMVELAIYNEKEELVLLLFQGVLCPGLYKLVWNGRGAHDQSLPIGNYTCRMEADGFSDERQLTILRNLKFVESSNSILKLSLFDRFNQALHHASSALLKGLG